MDVYYILLHCYIDEPIFFANNIILTPFGELSNNDFLEIIEKLTEPTVSNSHSKKDWSIIKEKLNKFHKEKNPISLLIFRNIAANTKDETYQKTKDYAQNIILTVGVLTNSSIELKGWIFQNNKGIIPDVHFPYYKPIYLNSKVLDEISKKVVNKMNDNYLIKLALRYENEALNDTEYDFSLLKRWTALEFIAEEYSKQLEKEKLLSKPDIKQITDFIINNVISEKNEKINEKVKTSVGHINHRNAKDKIRDFLKWLNYPLETYEKEKDVLDIIYQNRNCITHNGGCYKYDYTKKECNGPKYCKRSELDLNDINKELSSILVDFIAKSVGYEFKYN